MSTRSRLLCIPIFFAILLLAPVVQSGVLSLSAGLGYDLLSQEYFLDSIVGSGGDSLLINWSLTTDYLDDLKGLLRFKYQPLDDHRLEFRAAYDHTADFVRLRLTGDFRQTWDGQKILTTGEMEIKDRYRGESEFGDSYIRGYLRSRLTVPLDNSLNLAVQLKGDGVNFEKISTYSFNYFRVGGSVGLEKLFADYSYADIRLTVNRRTVPDSIELNYLTLGLESYGLFFHNHGELDLTASVYRKDYNRPLHQDDHFRINLRADHRWNLTNFWFSRQQFETDLILYHPDDPVNISYSQTTAALLAGLEIGSFSLAAGPMLEILDERDNEFAAGEDYTETGVRVLSDFMSPGKLFITLESTTGYRKLTAQSDLQSDFDFERLSLIGDLAIVAQMRLSFLLSGEWEWHGETTENSRLFLVSTNLMYEF